MFGQSCEDSNECVSQRCLSVSDGAAVCTAPCASASECPPGPSWQCAKPPGGEEALCVCARDADHEICGDGRDNDCDSVVDCPADAGDAGSDAVDVVDAGGDASTSEPECGASGCEPEATCETDPGLCPACADDVGCDDGVPCTEDRCRARGCVHLPRDVWCEAGDICDPRFGGCTQGRACANDADCVDTDACTQAEYCDVTAALCHFVFLDGDGDQHLPVSCGGDDCADDDPTVYPGALDRCDGIDNDCNGTVDPMSAALLCADDRVCSAGLCQCESGLAACRGRCVDPQSFQDDEDNCGACGTVCLSGTLCIEGACTDIDECADDPCDADATCSNFTGSYSCTCNSGYQGSGFTCSDIDECVQGGSSCDLSPASCVNTVGGFQCICPSGYSGSGVGSSGCQDVDECAAAVSPCTVDNSVCVNSLGGYACPCASGYEASGGACVDIDECTRGTDGCDDSPGTCTNTTGAFTCSCPETHTGDAIGAAGCVRRGTGVAAGANHACVLFDDGRVRCWGYNNLGQLGIGSTLTRGDQINEMGDALSVVALGTGRTATQLVAGGYHTCALLDDGSVRCWGDSAYGQLGVGGTTPRGDSSTELGDNLLAASLGTGRTATAIAAGANHTCALLDDATLKCWGYNSSGQLGLENTIHRGDQAGEMGDSLPVVSLGAGRTALAITAGGAHTCALLDDDSVKCWGSNTYGQLGHGNTLTRGDQASEMGDNLPVVSLGTGRTAKALAAGASHTCALLDDDSVKCWGRNNYGQLGLGNTLSRGDGADEMGDALPAVDLGAGRTATAIAAGDLHTCALLDDESVKCWGYNASGQLGLGNTLARGDGSGEMGDSLPAVSLGTGRSAAALSLGASHTCALLDDDSVKCWGYNYYGQLGRGDTLARGDAASEMGDALRYVDVGGL